MWYEHYVIGYPTTDLYNTSSKKYASKILYEDHNRSAKFKEGMFYTLYQTKPFFF